jgi:aminopeptidase N
VVGTAEFRAAVEAEAGYSLDRFFERWIYGSTLPQLKLTYRIEGADVVLRVEQVGELFDVPLTVTLQYRNRKRTLFVPVTERVVEKRSALEGTLRAVTISRDDGALADVVLGP